MAADELLERMKMVFRAGINASTTSEAAVPFQLRNALAIKARARANESQAVATYSKAINELARLQGQP